MKVAWCPLLLVRLKVLVSFSQCNLTFPYALSKANCGEFVIKKHGVLS